MLTTDGFKRVLKSKFTGTKKIIEIVFSNGMSLECTPDHRVLCYKKNGKLHWKQAQNMTKQDFICMQKPESVFSNDLWSSKVEHEEFFTKFNHKIYGPEETILNQNLGYVMGELIGDGYCGKTSSLQIAFGNNIAHAPLVKNIADQTFPGQWRLLKNKLGIELKIYSVVARRHFENFGLLYNRSPAKITPEAIFTSPPDVIRAYLRGLFDSDGTIVSNTGRNKDNIRIRLSSSSLRLLRETQLLLYDFGIKTSIIFNRPKGTPVGKYPKYQSNYDNYVLSVVGFDSYHNFARYIGFLDPKKMERMKEYTKTNKLKPEKTLPFAITTIGKIVSHDKAPVYDLEIEDAHMFSANGVFVHNSMFGYACNETPELMPLPIMLAHRLTRKLADVRKSGEIKNIGPDGKSQVSVEYHDGVPKRLTNVVIAAQHTVDIGEEELRKEIIEKVVKPVCGNYLDNETRIHINATGKFVIGGPEGDSGLTGRKIIVDTYGGAGKHGGGALSGKDPSKVDRSGAYAARYVAKNIVAAGLADKCEVAISYCIGIAEPTSINIETFGTNKIPEEKIEELVKKHFKLTPKWIIDTLQLRRPIYRKTAAYGHFGRTEPEFTWERTDKADILRSEAGL
ncbi:MAG: methionine adenosyltransferase [Candidatus Aenigmarchaeota archaeon]|nr:methionine adenosyltransferase [Candidatus Aenigmarchaeota archaeon]